MEAYQKINFEDSPSSTTPLNAANLNHMDDGIAAVNEAVTGLEGDKLDDADGSVKTANLDGGAVTEEKLAGGAITWAKLAAALQTVINGKEVKSNKKTTLTGNETSNEYYPTTKAVADALSTKAPLSTAYTFDSTTANVTYNTANPKTIYLNATVDGESGIILTTADNSTQFFFGGNGTIRKRAQNNPSAYGDWETIAEKMSNKKNAITNANKTSADYYPSIKAVADYLTANYLGNGNNTVSWDNLAVAVQNLINGKENTSNKLTSQTGIDSTSTDAQYPTAKAVFDFGAEIVDTVNEDISETNADVSDLKTYLGYTSDDILGLQADFENKVFTRLGAAVGKNAGSDFDVFPMYGGRRRVVVDSDEEIDDSIAPASVTEADYDLDVMVYQPKFYYKVVPLKLEKQSSGLGYHIRKANYYITSTPHAGFKVHPLFIDANGNEVDYVLLSAYEASYLHAETGNYHYFSDGTDTNTNIDWAHDVLKSMPGVKPISGQRKAMTKANMEALAQRKSSNWHLDTIKSVSANQLLMIIEMGQFNTQAAMGSGVVETPNNGAYNCSSLTGSTASLGNATGMAAETTYESAGNETVNTTNGKLSVSYRGLENPWGNIWKHVNGINLWGNGEMGGGQAYIADNFSFDEEAHSGNYHPAGFTIAANTSGWISAFAYGNDAFDWLFMPSEASGNSAVPVSDRYYGTENMNGYYIIRHGGYWNSSSAAGGFLLNCLGPSGSKANSIGGRLLYVPTAAV